ncbi:YybH family protein [Adhaeretor mobilis]|uniref:SnoaL-like domain protein n=1 Tax=Adhaeretor mobilis TaxID=1930276 RepID=A0A517MRQ2_9BACT|nr:SgcJ/EcaC family oxidoreductase [Adhaeretor mobilis]QDS97555.1 SnoaL-like domain protein [Adhaeretor mobilis]
MKYKIYLAVVAFWLCGVVHSASGQEDTAARDEDTAQITAAIQSYVAAFNARDVEKLANHWSPNGVYTSRTSGEQSVGREAMVEEFTAILAGESFPKLAVATESIEFISPNVALERGTATVAHSEDEVVETTYSVVYVKKDGTWLIDRVTEDEMVVELSHYENLKDLEWIIGEWIDETDGVKIEITCRWTENKNFISRTFAVSNAEEVESSGLQIIGWDSKEKKISSWLFDSQGNIITGTWAKRDDRWTVQSLASLAGGISGSFITVFQPLEDGTYTWQKINQVVDGELLPNIEKSIVRRK